MSLSDILAGLRLLYVLFGSASPILQILRGPLLTVVMMTGMLVSVVSVREGGLQAGLLLLLNNPHASDTMQRELRTVARRDAVIDGLLRALLAKAPTAARIRLAIIHNGEIGLTGVGLLRFDITHGVARQGFAVGSFVTNGPLSDWNSYLAKLLAAQCSVAGLEDMSPAEKGRMVELGVQDRLACPVADIQGRLLGGLFITWPIGAAVPEDSDMRALQDTTQAIAAQVAAAMIAAGE